MKLKDLPEFKEYDKAYKEMMAGAMRVLRCKDVEEKYRQIIEKEMDRAFLMHAALTEEKKQGG